MKSTVVGNPLMINPYDVFSARELRQIALSLGVNTTGYDLRYTSDKKAIRRQIRQAQEASKPEDIPTVNDELAEQPLIPVRGYILGDFVEVYDRANEIHETTELPLGKRVNSGQLFIEYPSHIHELNRFKQTLLEHGYKLFIVMEATSSNLDKAIAYMTNLVMEKLQAFDRFFPPMNSNACIGEEAFCKLNYIHLRIKNTALEENVFHDHRVWREMWMCEYHNDFSSYHFWCSCKQFIDYVNANYSQEIKEW